MRNKSEVSATSIPAISQEVINLYDEYTHAPLPRRVFMKRLSAITGSTAAASAVLPFLDSNYALAQTVPPTDPRLTIERVSYASDAGEVKGYLVYPKAATGKLPAVIVVHENRGLTPHIEDVARRAALAGYVALAPDYLSALGGTPSDEDNARAMFPKLEPTTVTAESLAGIRYLKTHAKSTGKVGAVGFCWGGGTVNNMAVAAPDLNAAVAFYGPQPKSADDIAKIQAPLLLHYAGLDQGIDAGIPAFEAALQASHKQYAIYMYEGVNHAFHNDTGGARYNEAAAKLAWQRTLDFFAKTLS